MCLIFKCVYIYKNYTFELYHWHQMGFLLTQTKHSTSSWDYESIILENVEKSSDTALWQKTNNENTTVDTRKPFLSACLDEHKLSCLSRVKETVMRLA